MKIHLISDLHCDREPYPHTFPECDLVVIAGDVAEMVSRMKEICQNNPNHKIVFVPGNHDYYGKSVFSFRAMISSVKDECPNLIVLMNDSVEFDDCILFGSTLWSGLDAYGPIQQSVLARWYPSGINDVNWISDWSSQSMITEHEISKNKINNFLQKETTKKKIVVTHFAPSLKSVHEKYANEFPWNSYWCNSMDRIVEKADLWLHGHVHTNFDYMIGDCRVVCNPRGYISRFFGVENEEFNPELVLEI